VKVDKADPDGGITRDELLAGWMLFLKKQALNPDQQSSKSYCLWTEPIIVVEASVRPLPPGLELPPGLDLPHARKAEKLNHPSSLDVKNPDTSPSTETHPAIDLHPIDPVDYKVLLQNLPGANLMDLKSLSIRENGGKALISFTTYTSVGQCIKRFHGRSWANSKMPVTATYVTTVKKALDASHVKESGAHGMSVDAPVFVPGSCLSADASAFVPGVDKVFAWERFSSYASTAADSQETSEGCNSEAEAQVAWAN
jgi:hypothetical protein